MSSAIGPFALDEGLVPAPNGREAVVRIHNTNTGKIIVARFPVEDGMAAVEGDLALDGVAGSGAPIRLEFHGPRRRTDRPAAANRQRRRTRWTSPGSARSR